MRIVNHDYCGYGFPFQLSRALAEKGHDVLHLYSASFQGPGGQLKKAPDDPKSLRLSSVKLDRPFQKWSFVHRRRQEIQYGQLVAQIISEWRPQVVLSGDTPTEAQRSIFRQCAGSHTKFVFWVQDIYSVAVHRILRRKLPVAGALIGRLYMRLERSILQSSDAIVLISPNFQETMAKWALDPSRVHVIPNWAVLESVKVLPKQNPWARKHGLDARTCFLYSGTLGMKHNPELLLKLAAHFSGNEQREVVVISEGPGADWLRQQCAERQVRNLRVMNWQPQDVMSQVLATADVLLAILEPEAGLFSVPSKVLTYLCAQRATLLSVPLQNLAARTVAESGAGLAVSPDNVQGFLDAAATLAADESRRAEMGLNARRYAEANFRIDQIADRFENVFRQALCET